MAKRPRFESSYFSEERPKEPGTGVAVAVAAGAGILALGAYALIGYGSKSEPAPEPEPEPQPEPEPEPEPAPEPEPEPEQEYVLDTGDLETNWGGNGTKGAAGACPQDLRVAFLHAEQTTGITGLARYLALVSWGEGKWKVNAHNRSEKEVLACQKGFFKRVNDKGWKPPGQNYRTVLKGTNTECRPTESSLYNKAESCGDNEIIRGWFDYGSAGLFGVLGPTGCYAGVNDGSTPLRGFSPEVLKRTDAGIFVAVWIAHRALTTWKLKTFLDFRILHALPAAVASPDEYTKVREGVQNNWEKHQKETGIDMSLVSPPSQTKEWVGAKAMFGLLTSL